MDFIIAEEGVPVSVGAYGAEITYYGSEIVLNYETEPPMGDFIFSAKLPLLDRELPFWMYGRNLVFLDAYYVIVESVKKKTWDPITTVIIDIHRGKYASLNHWYSDISVEDEVVLKNRFEKSTMILKDVDGLEWIQL
ncbi:hypothetical protein [Lachnoanaerobaculum saburreum]|uniref:Uncharacterized protein n=1 Tax=Lachnoanaerobaculum saburreum TaxID=467210 RepID=A0A133ZPL5_9FIRM|nr:hypothetical protein [Lachnoanaerobaculum saburreum]KXB57362.1 hypothetical protein HMPREF1866_01444 [Lachnoanaerobaculum saburreum]